MTEPAIKQRIAHEYNHRMLPAWASRGACAEIVDVPGSAWEAMFKDELGKEQDAGDYEWPAEVKHAMQFCARCPVSRECLEYGYEWDGLKGMGVVTMYVSHTAECNESYLAAKKRNRKPPRCDGCVPEPERLKEQAFVIEPMQMGVFGGVPGRIREVFMWTACQTCLGTGHDLAGFSIHPGVPNCETCVLMASWFPDKWAGKTGFYCQTCQGSGQVRRRDRVARAREWFEDYARARRWDRAEEGDRRTA